MLSGEGTKPKNQALYLSFDISKNYIEQKKMVYVRANSDHQRVHKNAKPPKRDLYVEMAIFRHFSKQLKSSVLYQYYSTKCQERGSWGEKLPFYSFKRVLVFFENINLLKTRKL